MIVSLVSAHNGELLILGTVDEIIDLLDTIIVMETMPSSNIILSDDMRTNINIITADMRSKRGGEDGNSPT